MRARRLWLPLLACGLSSALIHAATPQFWRLEGARAFLDGELEGVRVDSDGRIRLGAQPRPLFDPEAPDAWCVARDAKGVLYVGTGNEGRVVRIDGTRGSVLFDADELGVHAIAVGPDGRVYAATSPDGAVYAIDAAGSAKRFFDPAEKYIWALAFDAKGALYVATGVEGRIYRVQPDGRAETLLASTETHILSLAVAKDGRVYAGSAPEGLVYRLSASGRPFVVYDSPFREIKALDVGEDGSLYAAAIDGRAPETTPRPTTQPQPSTTTSQPGAEVTVTESFTVAAPAGGVGLSGRCGSRAAGAPEGRAPADPAVGRRGHALELAGRRAPLGRLDARGRPGRDGQPRQGLSRHGERPLGARRDAAGRAGHRHRAHGERERRAHHRESRARAVARGRAGRPRQLRVERQGRRVARELGAAQLGGRHAGGHHGEARDAPRQHRDAGRDVDRLDAHAALPAWHRPRRRASSSCASRSRETPAATPTVEAVTAAYLQRNLPPTLRPITVHPPDEAFQKPISASGDPEILGLDVDPLSERAAAARPPAGMPPAISFSRKLYQHGLRTFSWQADDPNGDALLFDVAYRALGDETWRPLRSGLSEPVFAWDTSTVPSGRYQIRVTASDAPANPHALALTVSRETPSFEVDNAPPRITATLDPQAPGVIHVAVHDDSTAVKRLELSIDAGPWEDVHPEDGIADGLDETFRVELPARTGRGLRVAVLRASDRLGNVATARVDVP